jgi:hypothetical protein
LPNYVAVPDPKFTVGNTCSYDAGMQLHDS